LKKYALEYFHNHCVSSPEIKLNIMAAIPYPPNEQERLAALQSYDLLDTGEEKDFDAIASIASVICQAPISLITFIDDKRQWFKSHIGTELTENSRELSFCTHTIASSQDIMIIPDANLDERFATNPVVTSANITFYAGVPLINEDGYALGTICVLDQKTHELTAEQVNALKALAIQVVDKIELRRKIKALEGANQELLNSNVLIQKFASMAAHDIKNPLSSILLTSQALKIRHEKLQDEGCIRLVDMNITSTKSLLTLVDDMLAYSKSPSLLIAKKQRFDLYSMLKKVIELLHVPDSISINLPEKGNELYLSIIAFEQIMINLISNAIRYNDKEKGIINIRFFEDTENYNFEVEDNGIGIPPEYHEKVFGNNFTLKITDRYNQKGSGIGLSTVRDLVTVLNGKIHLKSELKVGTTFLFSLKK
jgi:signal transduction histidine kinase